MAQGMSIHIGVDRVDPEHYSGWDGQLVACEKDAHAMAKIAKAQGIRKRRLLLTPDATAANVTQALAEAAAKLKPGDLLFLTFSGHGGQLPDWDFEEKDDLDETWLLYDRQLVDDELYALWRAFQPGVRILVLSDSCHSGTATRELPTPARRKARPPTKSPRGVEAHVILISGSQDDQVSLDGDENGLFTASFLKVWNGGAFQGGHQHLRREIADRMPPTQNPNYFVVGAPNRAFEDQKPLTVNPPSDPRRDHG
jgi:metacaspase-1